MNTAKPKPTSMHILLTSIYHFSDFIGGNERYAFELAQGLTSVGHQVTYLTSQNLPVRFWLNKPLPTRSWLSIPPGKFDLYHACGSGLPLHSLARMIKRHIPTVLTFQGPNNPSGLIMRFGSDLEYRLIASAYQGIITTSSQNLIFCRHTWPNIPSREIPLALTAPFLRAKLGKHLPGNKLLFVAKLDDHHYYKGLNVLLKSMTHLPKPYTLTVVGGGSLKTYYLELASTLGLNGKVFFTGEIPENQLLETYREHDLFIFPSTNSSEGFGLSLLEAMAVGIPVITTTCIGLAPLLRARHLATLIPPNQEDALTHAILDWPKTDHQAQINRAFAYAHGLSTRAMTEKTLTFYQQFL